MDYLQQTDNSIPPPWTLLAMTTCLDLHGELLHIPFTNHSPLAPANLLCVELMRLSQNVHRYVRNISKAGYTLTPADVDLVSWLEDGRD